VIVGLAGAAGVGKTTLAKALEARGFAVIAFADPIYEAVAAIVGMPVEALQQRSIKEAPLEWLGRSPRHLMQTLGTEWGRESISQTIWIDIAMHRAQHHQHVVIPDVRFDNEARAIRAYGGRVWRLRRDNYRPLEKSCSNHSSEAGVSDHLVDLVIDNSGGPERMIRSAFEALAGSSEAVK
jgi:hypothetical protein